MKITKKAFSLIEVIVASIILTIAVFGVFKLIGENEKLINNSDNYKVANSLFISFQECLKNIGTPGNQFYLNLENCSTGAISTGIILDNIEYILYGSGSNGEYKLKIETDSIKIEQDYNL